MKRIFTKFFLLGIFLSIAPAINSSAEGYQPNPYQVKAALLYNFAKFVRWPNGAQEEGNEQVVFGILGTDPFGEGLDKLLNGKTIGGKKIVLKRYKKVSDLQPSHILFVNLPIGEFQNLGPNFTSATLTVGDTKGFIEAGGVISFIDRPGRVSFEINKNAASDAGLEISSALLGLADKVID